MPALAKLKLVFGARAHRRRPHRARQSADRYRIEVPGPKVSEGAGDDERLALTIPKTMFKLLADEGELADWREAFHYGHLKVDGDSRVKRLLGQAIGGA